MVRDITNVVFTRPHVRPDATSASCSRQPSGFVFLPYYFWLKKVCYHSQARNTMAMQYLQALVVDRALQDIVHCHKFCNQGKHSSLDASREQEVIFQWCIGLVNSAWEAVWYMQ